MNDININKYSEEEGLGYCQQQLQKMYLGLKWYGKKRKDYKKVVDKMMGWMTRARV